MKPIENCFDLAEVNKVEIKEASFIRVSKIHDIHMWFARKPCRIARINSLTVQIKILNRSSAKHETIN